MMVDEGMYTVRSNVGNVNTVRDNDGMENKEFARMEENEP